MFLRREYRDRAVGLIAAYAVLITGVVATEAFEPAPMHATEAALDRSKTKRADDCSSALQCRSDIVC